MSSLIPMVIEQDSRGERAFEGAGFEFPVVARELRNRCKLAESAPIPGVRSGWEFPGSVFPWSVPFHRRAWHRNRRATWNMGPMNDA